MIKKIALLVMLGAAAAVLGLGLWYESIPLRFEEGRSDLPALAFNDQMMDETIEPFCQDGVWYYCLPGYIETQKILLPWGTEKELQVDGKSASLVWSWEEEKTHTFTWKGQDYQVQFLRNSQLPTLFIHTESGSLEEIHRSKNHEETGHLLALDASGTVEYQGDLKRIKGRGNSTFSDYDKKPYSIKLEESFSLAGLEESKDYTLLALAFDGDKIHSKLGLEVASALGENDTEAQWVALYINGEWRGLYLLATSVSHLDQFQEEGAVLLEKDMESRYLESGNGFTTQDGNHFSVKRPQEINENDLTQLENRINQIETSILAGKPDFEMMDLDSFAVQILTEEVTRNFDAYKTSSFYYYLPGDDTLYAGPMWDYDGAFGEFTRLGIWWNDPAGILLEDTPEMFAADGRLTWPVYLYQNETFKKRMKEIYAQSLTELRALAEKIPQYEELIQDSVLCDQLRWPASSGLAHEGKYVKWENNVRYLRYFFGQRLNSLCEAWNISWDPISFMGNGSVHTVTFTRDGEQVAQMEVKDGTLLGWQDTESFYPQGYYLITQYGGLFTLDLPVLEDCTLDIVLNPPAN